jgi:hypothetical protein
MIARLVGRVLFLGRTTRADCLSTGIPKINLFISVFFTSLVTALRLARRTALFLRFRLALLIDPTARA